MAGWRPIFRALSQKEAIVKGGGGKEAILSMGNGERGVLRENKKERETATLS